MYSATVELSGNGFEGISLASLIALVAFLSDLFKEALLATIWLV